MEAVANWSNLDLGIVAFPGPHCLPNMATSMGVTGMGRRRVITTGKTASPATRWDGHVKDPPTAKGIHTLAKHTRTQATSTCVLLNHIETTALVPITAGDM